MQFIIVLYVFLIFSPLKSVAQSKAVITTAKTADQVATIVLVDYYGEHILKQKPFKIKDNGSVWLIKGQIPKDNNSYVGGLVQCEIRKKDGAFVNILHTK